ncbi:ribonuclease HII [Candidatus Dojkabacteria bacterium]|uniref:Ribonuclease HII n=1 Tax=Candidatus Dojkabacteria bacterium TaxID=2099670 RepID=A0A847VD67_9BACT|nr:ribonuclease HII [Candidatus Dojkabacteria bacterium]
MQLPDTKLEEKLWARGIKYVVGIDEAGRGSLAGPVCAGAVVLDRDTELNILVRDSKQMSKKNREKAYEYIISNSLASGVHMISSARIDSIGIQDAVKEAMEGALYEVEKMLGNKVQYIIVDGINVMSIPGYSMYKIKEGDVKHYSISAASILAKVTRDRYMESIAQKYPEYCFEKHKGYGTKYHTDAIKKHGPCKIHRKTFKPIKNMF